MTGLAHKDRLHDGDALRDHAVRAEYIRAVASLADTAAMMLGFGLSEEVVARTLHSQRRALGEKYKEMTTAAQRRNLYRRNTERYGDRRRPGIDHLRSRGNTWSDIIASASRPGRL